MAFAISDGKTTLYTDFPYESGCFGYMTYDFARVPKAPERRVPRHARPPRPLRRVPLREDGLRRLIAPPSLVAGDGGGPRDPVRAEDVVPATSRSRPSARRTATIEHSSYLVTWHGRRLYFTGDTDSADQLLAMKDLDVAFVSPWLIEAVAEKNGRIDARRVVCYHHQTDEKVADLPGPAWSRSRARRSSWRASAQAPPLAERGRLRALPAQVVPGLEPACRRSRPA